MLKEKEVIELLKISLQEYINKLQRENFSYIEHGAEAKAYMKVLNKEEFKCKFLSKDRAMGFLEKIEKLSV